MKKFLVTIRSNGAIQHLRVIAACAAEAAIIAMDRFPLNARVTVSPLP